MCPSGRSGASAIAFPAAWRARAADSAYQLAAVWAARGEPDAMFSWLDRALVQRDGGLLFAPIEPVFRPYDRDPRWAAFMGKLGVRPASSDRAG